jgi:drug/metabolite transporter (DMT)-like permease
VVGAASVSRTPAHPEATGLALGLLGVLAFSLTLPMTRFAVQQLDPWFLAFARMAGAGLISALLLLALRARWPQRADLPLLAACIGGIVIGFPLLTSLAMKTVPANHGAVVIGTLPLATALVAALWFGERQPPRFWICAAAGALLVAIFTLRDGGAELAAGDWALLGAVATSAVGYAAGARLAQRLGGIRVILWALVLALPLTAPVALALTLTTAPRADALHWGAFGYVTLISQLAGFFAWYNGLAIGGIARVGQVQLLQVFFTIGFAGLLFGEAVAPSTWLFALAVAATIALGRGRPRPALVEETK